MPSRAPERETTVAHVDDELVGRVFGVLPPGGPGVPMTTMPLAQSFFLLAALRQPRGRVAPRPPGLSACWAPAT